MARVDLRPEDRDRKPLQLEALLDCETCGVMFDHVFTAPDGVFEPQDLYEQPEEDVTCPNGHTNHYQYGGWAIHDEA